MLYKILGSFFQRETTETHYDYFSANAGHESKMYDVDLMGHEVAREMLY
jgi:hypothetical protein